MRQGPCNALMVKAGPTTAHSSITLSGDGLTAENTSANDNRYVKGNVKVKAGKWYYEAKISNNQIAVGWVTQDFDVSVTNASSSYYIGEDVHGWGYDVSRQRKTHKGGTYYGEYFSIGDVLGCAIDFESKKFNFYRNGKDMGVAYEGTDFEVGDGVWPAASLGKKGKAIFNFGKSAWSYPPPADYKGLQSLLNDKELEELNKIFNKYKAMGVSLSESGETGDIIKGQGFLTYGKDIGVIEDSDTGLMVLAWKFDARGQWEFTREQFVEGWAGCGVKNIAEMKKKLGEWKDEIQKKPTEFKKFYFFLFDYLREDKARTNIPKDDAVVVWQMLGFDTKWKLWDKWLAYLGKDTKSISRDNWRQFVDFISIHEKDISNYDPNESWPVLMDGFVEYMTEGEGKED